MLKIKKEYKGLTITRTHKVLGTLVMNTKLITDTEYQFYYDNGFKDVFTKGKIIKYKGI